MRTVGISGLLALAGIGLAIPVGRHWSEARLEGGAFWRRTKLGFWCAALALCLAYANLAAQFAPRLMEAVGLEDVRFFLTLRAFSPFLLCFLLLPALYALLYWRALRAWKNGIYAELDRARWDTAYTRAWGNDVIRSQAVYAGFFSFLKSSLETGRRTPGAGDRRADDLRIAGRPGALRQALPPEASGRGATCYPWHSYHRSGRYAGGHSFTRAPSPAPGGAPVAGGFSGTGGQTRGGGAGRSFASSGGSSFQGGGAYRVGSGLARSVSGGGFRGSGGKSRGSGAGRSFGESAGFSSAARMGAAYGMGTRSGGGKSSGGRSSGGKSGSSGKKGKGGGGAAGIGAALLAALRAILMFLLVVLLVAVVLFAGYGTAWLVVRRQDGKHHFFQELEQLTRAHAA